MKIKTALLITSLLLSIVSTASRAQSPSPANQPIFQKLDDAKWNKILPDLGDNSPQICILHIDPDTHATQLLIRTPKAIHVRKHWHAANETHTMVKGTAVLACEGKRAEIGPGGFNFYAGKDGSRSLVAGGLADIHHRRRSLGCKLGG